MYCVPSNVTLKFSHGVPGVKKSNELLNVPLQVKSYWMPGFVLLPTPSVPSDFVPILIQRPAKINVLAVGSGVRVRDAVAVFVGVLVAVYVGVNVYVGV